MASGAHDYSLPVPKRKQLQTSEVGTYRLQERDIQTAKICYISGALSFEEFNESLDFVIKQGGRLSTTGRPVVPSWTSTPQKLGL